MDEEYPLHPYELPINLSKPIEFTYWYNFQKMLSEKQGYNYRKELAPYSVIMTRDGSSIRFKTEADMTFFLLRFS